MNYLITLDVHASFLVQWRPFYMLEEIQISLSLMLNCPVPNLVKVLACMRGSHISNHSLLRLTPFPVDRTDV